MYPGQLILASQSPRRRELLDQIGVHYKVVSADIDEIIRDAEPAAEFAARMAREKTLAVVDDSGLPVLGADTVVVVDGQVLGKPASRAEAAEMLKALSGRKHEVITAVALRTAAGDCLEADSTTTVEFKELSSTEIEDYCACDEPLDKAGAYAIQGLAAMFISRVNGSYSGVMGLPLFETAKLLRAANITLNAA